MPLTRRELLAAGGAAALTASCGHRLQRAVCVPKAPACPKGTRCELWAYDEIHRAEASVYRPANTGELASLLRAFSRRDPAVRVTVRGGGQALDGQALNDDVVIQLDCADLDRIGTPRSDGQGHYITVGATATWGNILAETTRHGLVPYSVVTTSRATAGGTLSSNCVSRCSAITGREGRHVQSFKLLTADGTQIECRRNDPDPDRAELFHAAIGGYGYLGVIIEITFDLRPPIEGWAPGKPVRALTHVSKLVLDDQPKARWNGLLQLLLDARRVGTWDAVSVGAWFAGPREQALLFRSRYVVDQALAPLPLYDRTSPMALVTPPGAMTRPRLTELGERTFFLLNREGLYTNKIEDFAFFMENQFEPMKASANRAGWRLNVIQQTFVLPSACAPDDPAGAAAAATFLNELRSVLRARRERPSMIDVFYLPEDEFLLSANRAMCGFAVTLTWADRDARSWSELRARLRELAHRCRELGGRVHMVKNVDVDSEDLAAMYRPAFDRFLALKKRHDKRGSLRNEFFDHIFGATT